jgi:hypothetical protein
MSGWSQSVCEKPGEDSTINLKELPCVDLHFSHPPKESKTP